MVTQDAFDPVLPLQGLLLGAIFSVRIVPQVGHSPFAGFTLRVSKSPSAAMNGRITCALAATTASSPANNPRRLIWQCPIQVSQPFYQPAYANNPKETVFCRRLQKNDTAIPDHVHYTAEKA